MSNELVKNEEKPNEAKPLTVTKFFLDIIISSIILTFIFLALLPHYPQIRPSRLKDNCFSEIRLIAGAVELYNLDNEIKINKLDEKTLQTLVDTKYLKRLPDPFIEKCKYSSEGDLATDTGIIYCEAHGDLNGKIKSKYSESQIADAIYAKEKENKTQVFSIVIASILLISFLSATIFDIIIPKILGLFK